MAPMATVQAQVDADVVNQATAVLKKQGMDVSEAVGLLLSRVARDGGLLLEPGESAEYDAWVCAKVQEAMDDPRPLISHEEARRRMMVLRAELLAKAS
jgi:DNA-damage-inducible protein J